MVLLDEALRYGGLTVLSDSYAINGQPGDFYSCSKGTINKIRNFHILSKFGQKKGDRVTPNVVG
jgi:hypothetical protein